MVTTETLKGALTFIGIVFLDSAPWTQLLFLAFLMRFGEPHSNRQLEIEK